MNLEQVIEAIKSTYDGHQSLSEIVDDLSGGNYINHWAERLCDDEFNKNNELAKELFVIFVDTCESVRELNNVAFQISREDVLNDHEWARDLYRKAIEMASDNVSELRLIADNIICDDSLNDKQWARKIYKKIEGNLCDLSEFNELIDSIGNNLNDRKWSLELINKAKDSLLSAEDRFEFAGYSSTIIELAKLIADINFGNDKESAKDLFEILKDYEGVTCLLDAAREVKEIYEDESDYVATFMNECLKKSLEYMDDGYYCDVYYFIKDDMEDEDRAQEFMEEYEDEMRNDYENYGGCGELFEDNENDIDLDDIDFDNYDDERNAIRIGLKFLYSDLEELLEEEEEFDSAKEIAQEKISEFIDTFNDKVSGNMEDNIYYMSSYSDESVELDNISGISIEKFDVEFDNLSIYIVLAKKIPRDILDRIALDMVEYDFTLEALNDDGDLVYQNYSQGEYDSGYYMASDDEDAFVNQNLDKYEFAKERLNVEGSCSSLRQLPSTPFPLGEAEREGEGIMPHEGDETMNKTMLPTFRIHFQDLAI
ncbi:hypothetical protein D5085_00650 [Ectothiorhodospiraceae bacterium BW-2]|nr:hypothetical protein D5085_00650 [Ectothiorhodospiraceae bacterium BW-2]